MSQSGGGGERRGHERYDVSLPITFECLNTHTTYRGTVKNIGLGGVLLETVARLTRMERLTLHFPAGAAGTLTVGAVVVRYHVEASFGIAFVALGREDQQRVRTLIEQHEHVKHAGTPPTQA